MTSVTGPKNTKFYTQTYRPSEPPIALAILVHGINEHIDRYTLLFERFASRNIAVFAYDQRGFGKTAKYDSDNFGISTGADQLADLDFFIQHALNEVANGASIPIFLLGHSMGGGIVLDYITNTSHANSTGRNLILSTKGGVISQAPWITSYAAIPTSLKVRVGSFASKLLPSWVKIPVNLSNDYLTRDPAVNEAYAKDSLCKTWDSAKLLADCIARGVNLLDSAYAQYPKSVPILFVHGDADKITSHHATEEFSQKINADDKTVKIFPGYYHEVHLEVGNDKIVEIDYLIQWITDHASLKTKL